MDGLQLNDVLAGDPDLDPGFGNERGYFFPIPGETSDVRAVVLNTDESLNLAIALHNGKYQFNRANADGFPIPDFQPTTAEFASNGTSVPTRLLRQPDNKIIMIGTFTNHADSTLHRVSRPAVTRFNADGTPDPDFGHRVLPFTPEGVTTPLTPRKMADGCLQPDGKILIASVYQRPDPNGSNVISRLTRLNSDGTPDTSFANAGSIELIFDGATTDAANVQVQKSGKIVVAGWVVMNGQHQLTLARYTNDGEPDMDFGKKGYARYIHPKHNAILNRLEVYDDKLVCAGFTTGPEHGALLMRFDADGHADPQFNDGEPVLTRDEFSVLQWACISVQPNGDIIALGNDQNANGKEFIIRRFTERGQPDLSRKWQTKPLTCSDVATQSSKRLIVTAKTRSGYSLVLGLLS
ncbi:hypothetical protein [Pseudomonas sp. Irchel s3h17]|uniref:hypothetical protein n=1 Tax=Pseudomonas sp. Irchel s3h17 TaxID=2009182 RepID=UPI000BA4DAF4|nr:hypothetical protein [Pseudomonas sp. Irchel s3h17]